MNHATHPGTRFDPTVTGTSVDTLQLDSYEDSTNRHVDGEDILRDMRRSAISAETGFLATGYQSSSKAADPAFQAEAYLGGGAAPYRTDTTINVPTHSPEANQGQRAVSVTPDLAALVGGGDEDLTGRQGNEVLGGALLPGITASRGHPEAQ